VGKGVFNLHANFFVLLILLSRLVQPIIFFVVAGWLGKKMLK
jgi:hypothetical protein